MYDKEKLKEKLQGTLKEKINILRSSISEAQNSSNNETKSTAGDKHETSRAMAQLEVERLSQQLQQQERLYTLLSSVSTSKSSKVEAGAIVKTNKGIFYPIIATGIIKFDNQNIMTVGMGAPVTQAMLGRLPGDSFSFNGNKYHIEEIF